MELSGGRTMPRKKVGGKTVAKGPGAPRASRMDLEGLFMARGFDDFRWVDPGEIVTAEWVRMKCRYGCVEYGHNAACPPNAPSVEECARFIGEYRRIVVFHF